MTVGGLIFLVGILLMAVTWVLGALEDDEHRKISQALTILISITCMLISIVRLGNDSYERGVLDVTNGLVVVDSVSGEWTRYIQLKDGTLLDKDLLPQN